MQRAIENKRRNEIEIVPESKSFSALIDKELMKLFPKRKIQRVLLIVPPDGDSSLFDYVTAKRGRYYNYPPYGLGIIASYLKGEGIDVHIINLNNEVLKSCRNSSSKKSFHFDSTWKVPLSLEMDRFKPDFIGTTCMFTQTHESTVLVCEEIKRLRPEIPLALGGVHITNCFMSRKKFNDALNDFSKVDLFFLFESEMAFKYFIQAVNKKASTNGLFQVYFNSSPRKLYFSKTNIPNREDLNVIPSYDLMSIEEMSNNGVIGSFTCLKKMNARCATVLSNRGCRGRCTYCSVRNFNGPGVRCRSIQSVIDELLLLRNQYGIDHIMWLDDDLFYDHKRIVDLFNEMVRKNVGITWDATNGVIATSCKEEIIAAAAESGCIGLNVGIESGNPEILKRAKKPGRIVDFLNAAEVLRKFEKINARVFLMIGFPNETYRMILDTFNLAVKMDLDWYNITTLQPLPNTPIFDIMVEQGMVDSVSSSEIRYNTGPYGKKRERMIKKLFPSEYTNPFDQQNLDEVPPRSQLEDIWLYMNFHLNFKRLFKVQSPIKLEQQLKYLKYITELIAPDDPFPMYFCGYLEKKIRGKTDMKLVSRLETCLDSSQYWKNCLSSFGLSPSHLRTGQFPLDA